MPFFGDVTLADILRDLANRSGSLSTGKDLLSTLYTRRGSSRSSRPPESVTDQTRPSRRRPAAAAEPVPDGTVGPNLVPPKATGILRMLESIGYVDACLWIASRLADGLAHAHDRGILHLDLKPANVLLTDEGQPMLLDFNMARDTKRRPAGDGVGGTLPYMAPEHLAAFAGEPVTVDARADVFGLGVILFELLARRRPFPPSTGGTNEVPALIAARKAGPGPLRECSRKVSPAVESIVRKCLAPNPADRYQSAQDLGEDLRRQLSHRPLRFAADPSPRERLVKWVRRHPKLASGTTAAVVCIALVAGLAGGAVVRTQRLGRLEALAELAQFEDDARDVQFLLAAKGADHEQLDAGLAAGRDLLDRYRVLDDPHWPDRPAVRELPGADQDRLREMVGDALLLVAQGEASRAERQSPESARTALDLNRRAADLFAAGEVPRAVWLQRARLLNLLGDAGGAARASDAAAAIPLRSARDQYLVGADHVAAGRYREAVPHLAAAGRLDPQHFWAAFLQGVCHDALAQDAAALAAYRACLALRPEFPWTWFNRGLVYLRQKDYVNATADFDRVIDLRPADADAYLNRALARSPAGDDRGAAADLTAALDRGAAATRVHLLRARVLERLGDVAGAARDRAAGMRQEPGDETGWVTRGVARLDADLGAALADFEAALKLNPRSLAALQNAAHVLGRLGRTAEAIRRLDRLVDLYPDFVPARTARAVYLARLGQREKARADVREALHRDTSPSNLYQAAGVYALTAKDQPDDRREALRLLSAALRQGFGFDLLAIDRDLDPIRDDPEFAAIVAAARALGEPEKR
jgi:tetratricopeptide (TPR) repeat protein